MTHPAGTPEPDLLFAGEDDEGFGAYHDLYAVGSTVSRGSGRFEAAVTAHRFPRLLIFARRLSAVVHQRDPARVLRDAYDHYTLQVVRSGAIRGGAPGDERLLGPGDVMLFDTTRPQRTVIEAADSVTVSLARGLVEASLPGAHRLHGRILPRSISGLLGDTMMSLARHGAELTPRAAASGATMMADLLAGIALDQEPAGIGPADASASAAELLRLRADDVINANLGRTSLDADAIAAALGLSRSTLFRAFAPVGGVERRITHKRVEGLRLALLRRDDPRTFTALAFDFGFKSESHCRRVFKAAYGTAPAQFRAEVEDARRLFDRCGKLGSIDGWHRALV